MRECPIVLTRLFLTSVQSGRSGNKSGSTIIVRVDYKGKWAMKERTSPMLTTVSTDIPTKKFSITSSGRWCIAGMVS